MPAIMVGVVSGYPLTNVGR